MGWGYDQTLDTPMLGIVAALKGRHRFVNDVLTAIFGPSDATPTPAKAQPLSPQLFDSMFGA